MFIRYVTLLALAAPTLCRADGKATVEMESCPKEVRIGDILFVRLTVANPRSESVEVFPSYSRDTSSLSYGLRLPTSRYSYSYWSGAGSGFAPKVNLAPGHSIVMYDALKLPPPSELRHTFWRELVDSNGGPALTCYLGLQPRDTEGFRDLPKLHGRAAAEVDLIVQAHEKCQVVEYGREATRRLPPANFTPFWPKLEPETLRKLDEGLSPGTLHDVVRLTRIMYGIDAAKDPAQQERSVDELLQWFDTLPEIERYELALRVRSWITHDRSDPHYLSLSYGLIDRLPRQYLQDTEYRKHERERFMTKHRKFESHKTTQP